MKKENSVNPITLGFYDKQTEKEFIKEYADRSKRIVRIGLLLGSISLIVAGFILDQKFFPDNPQILHRWRIAGASVMISTAVLVGFRSIRKHFQMFLLVTLCAAGIAIMKTALTYQEAGMFNHMISTTAYIIFIHTLSRIRFIYSVVFTWGFILIFLILLYNISPPEATLFQMVLFFTVINLFGMSASYGIEFNIRDAFIKSKQLQTSRQLLEAEHKRTSEELASVKELQLSMLPENAPSLNTIDIAFHMSTATEVGGDYCDYVYAKDDSLTFAIGDATGHGARASTMVMAVKILFTEYAVKESISDFLRHASSTIKSLRLPKLYMTLAIGRISENKLEISGAGIPPALLYKANDGTIEHITLKGIPLGAFVVADYKANQFSLEPGDVIVLMTDGVTELYNSKGEMYGTNSIEDQIKECSNLSAQEIINQLINKANLWRGEEPLHDDMTMLVLKIKG